MSETSSRGSGLFCHLIAPGKSLDLKLETNLCSDCAMTPGGHLFFSQTEWQKLWMFLKDNEASPVS